MKKFEIWIQQFVKSESLKQLELNRILDKISTKSKLTIMEKKFLDFFNQKTDDDLRDYNFLSNLDAYNRVKQIFDSGKTVICNLKDRDGCINQHITSMEETDDFLIVNTRKCGRVKLTDRFLYNIIYIYKKDQYSLEEQDEYFEKINVNI